MSDYLTVEQTLTQLAGVIGSGKLSKNVETMLLSAHHHLSSLQAQLADTKQYLFHTPDCDMSIAHNLMGTSPNGCNCGLIELQAILK